MTIPIIIDGALTVIPGVYSTFSVQNSLPSPAPAGRSAFIFGEAEEGAPGAELDLRLNYFQSFADVKDYYKSGAIVDSARMLFTRQPSPQVFSGSIDRLYVYKTNDSKRALRTLAGPSGYGEILAARFGEPGNMIRTQVVDASAETKPSKTFKYLPTPSGRTIKVTVNGVVHSVVIPSDADASDLVTLLNAIPSISATGGTSRAVLDAADIDLSLAATNDTLTLTRTSGANFSEIEAGDIAYISTSSALAASGTNSGAYLVMSASATEVVMKQLKAVAAYGAKNVEAFDTTAVAGVEATDLVVCSDITIEVTEATKTGSASAIEISSSVASKDNLELFTDESFQDLLNDATSTLADITATANGSSLSLQLSIGSWRQIPRIGDLVRIERDSIIAGANLRNVGTLVVTAASSRSLTLQHYSSMIVTESVAQTALTGANGTLKLAQSFVSSDVAARRIDSEAERTVRVLATQVDTNATIPNIAIGGQTALEIGYHNPSATAATLSITTKRELIITPVGPSLNPIRVLLNKYRTLESLVTFLNTLQGISARVQNAQDKSRSTKCLDAVQAIGCLQPTEMASYPAKIKRDYEAFTEFFVDNFSLVAFRAGNMIDKAGLPDADASPIFLAGAELGSTNMASVQAALDAAKKITVRLVVPLFSRDAVRDIADGLTDEASSYTIDAIHSASRSHVMDVSDNITRKFRHAILSYYGSFAESVEKVGMIANERCMMCFQTHTALNAEGENVPVLPYIAAAAFAAGRAQARLGTPLLRKPFALSSAEHYGDVSLYEDTLTPDFDAEDQNQLSDAITAGLLVFRAVPGFGVRLESPDLTTRSRVNDPQAWVYERGSVEFVYDEVRDTVHSVLDAYIGNEETETPVAVVRTALNDALKSFLPGQGGSGLVGYEIISVERIGLTYKAKVKAKATEAIEAIIVDVEASREI